MPDLSSLEAALGVLGWRIADMLERQPGTAPAATLLGHNGGPALDGHADAGGMQ